VTSGSLPRQASSPVDQTLVALLIGTIAVLAALVLALWLAVFSDPVEPAAPPPVPIVGPQDSDHGIPEFRERR
jgi:hypothetical protein